MTKKESTNEKARARVAAYRETDEWRAWYEGFREQRLALKRKYRLGAHKNDAHVKEWVAVRNQEAASMNKAKEAQAIAESNQQKEDARVFFFGLGMKLCCSCGLLHGLNRFCRSKRFPDGLDAKCTPCYVRYNLSRRRADPLVRLQYNLSQRIRGALRRLGYVKGSRTHEILGCDFQEMKRHLERQFTSGMKWEMLGVRIHIDHIVPLSSATTEAEVLRLNHFTNLRPMWAADNLRKGAKRLHLL